MEATIYDSSMKIVWDEFIEKAVNSHFMHYRDYMNYHSDRFQDQSLLFRDEKSKLIAVMPANISDGVLYSHQGLTFGGILVCQKTNAISLLKIFDSLKSFCEANSINKIIYKRSPDFYYNDIYQDDLYALYLNGANLIRRDLNSTVALYSNYKYSKGRKWTINKAKKECFEVSELKEYDDFWNILTEVLKNHGAVPTHSVNEISLLANSFPENIKLFVVRKDNELLAGTVLFINNEVVHTQYMASTLKGRDTGALDFLIHQLMSDLYKDKRYFNFGISTEESGRYLNEGLLLQKAGFGARSTVHEFYEINI